MPLPHLNRGLQDQKTSLQFQEEKTREFTLDLLSNQPSDVHAYFKRLQKQDRLPDVRTLTVLESSENGRASVNTEVLRALGQHLRKLNNLRTLVYHGTLVPEPILSATTGGHHLALRLHLAIAPDSPRMTQSSPWHESQHLDSFSVDLTYFEAADCLSALQHIKSVIVSSPSLQILGLRIAHASSLGQSQRYHGLGFTRGVTLPNLQELELTGYPFGRPRTERQKGVELNSEGYPEDEDEISLWADLFDWTRLRRLKTDNAAFAKAIMPHLASLEDFVFLGLETSPGTTSFFHDVPSSLTKIQIPTLGHASLEGLARHGNSLRMLQIHQPDTTGPTWRSEAVSLSSIERIRARCPHTRNLSLDLPRSGDWPFEIFDILASFPELEELELWFELGAHEPAKPVEPYLTRGAAGHLCSYLIRDAKRPSLTLQKLKLHCGDIPQTGAMNTQRLPQAYWPLYNRSSFLCERSSDLSNPISIKNLLARSSSQKQSTAIEQSTSSDSRVEKSWKRICNLLPTIKSSDGVPDKSVRPNSRPDSAYDELAEVAERGPRPLSS